MVKRKTIHQPPSESWYWVSIIVILLFIGLIMFDGIYQGPLTELGTFRNPGERMLVPVRTPVIVRVLSSDGTDGLIREPIWRQVTKEELAEMERQEKAKRGQ